MKNLHNKSQCLQKSTYNFVCRKARRKPEKTALFLSVIFIFCASCGTRYDTKISISSGAFFLLLLQYFFQVRCYLRVSRIPSGTCVSASGQRTGWDMDHQNKQPELLSRSASKNAFTTSPPSARSETKTEKRRQACSNCCAIVVLLYEYDRGRTGSVLPVFLLYNSSTTATQQLNSSTS